MEYDDRNFCGPDESAGAQTTEVVAVKKKILEVVRVVPLPQIGAFVAAEKFVAGKTVDGIRVGWIGGSFQKRFLCKTEDPAGAVDIREHALLRKSHDDAISTALGGEGEFEIGLGHYWEFLQTANRKLRYTAYIKDCEGTVLAVLARWYRIGLRVDVRPLHQSAGWLTGRRFLSR